MKKIGKYKVIRQLGAGGFGAVYLAEDKLGEQVAIKIFKLRDQDLGQLGSSMHQRFRDEARILRKLSTNPHIVEMYHFDEMEDGTPYYVMPFLEKSLEQEVGKDAFTAGKLEEIPQHLHPRPAPLSLAVAWLRQILEALEAVHRAGLVHRDIKPANIMFNSDGRVQLVDFGIAKLPDSEHSESGVGMGTRYYMSPEQRESAKHVGAQSDVFSVGVLAYRMLTGVMPIGRYRDPVEYVPDLTPEFNQAPSLGHGTGPEAASRRCG
ncbi:MAG: serine/threonine-protein kinase [Halioglobus sp.]|nr:serine/threonine-protein kinase [Halioglobus sp.]